MLKELKQKVYEANMMLPEYGLVTFTWGNASGIDRERGLVVIKPSGVEYDELEPSMLPVIQLWDGEQVDGELSPSSDTPTHLALYRAFESIGGVVHTHSRWATIFAQAGCGIPPLGTTHADYFYGEIPCTRALTDEEIGGDYEAETGKVIIETFNTNNTKRETEVSGSGRAGDSGRKILPDYADIPAALVHSHGPFTWGTDPISASHAAAVLEEVANMAWHTLTLALAQADKAQPPISPSLLNKHYSRKHGKNAYYGQR
jgi:L-ribulose-5-phosphate 4-epimerase